MICDVAVSGKIIESESSAESQTDTLDFGIESETSENLGEIGNLDDSSEGIEQDKDIGTSHTYGGGSTGAEGSATTDDGDVGDTVVDTTTVGEKSTSSEENIGVVGDEFWGSRHGSRRLRRSRHRSR